MIRQTHTSNSTIDTEGFSATLRSKAIDIGNKSILITRFTGSQQEKDFSEPANCDGYGRIRHFKFNAGLDWPQNPLPILPAAKALGVNPGSEIRAQVFQNSICNWRCWYCFVDYQLLAGDSKKASMLTCEQMLDLYSAEESPPIMIDLTGGQPDLTPEWIPWMMEALIKRGLENKIFLWSDDNLSNDYFWRFLNEDQIRLVSSYQMYSRVCCFKGIDSNSFALNTKASGELFEKQFDLCQRLVDAGIDMYCYITLTATTDTNFAYSIGKFLDKIQNIHPSLPLRIVPLKITEFTPVIERMNVVFKDMVMGQYKAIDVWQKELQKRFSSSELNMPITEINIKRS